MGARANPVHIDVNDDLAAARPLSPDEFIAVKEGEVEQGELSDDAKKFYNHVVELAKNIDQNGQKHPVTVCDRGGGNLELVSGYSRYLACRYSGNSIKYEKEQLSEKEVLEWMYAENESRHDLDPERRAVLIAKNMNRWDDETGEWVPDSEIEENPNVDSDSALTIAEFAEKTGKNRGLIYQQLSPLRQNSEMRDEFGEEITETSFQLIERIAEDKSEQYTLAQALSKSDVDTHSRFQSSYKLAKKSADEDDNLVNIMCRKLIGLDIHDPKSAEKPTPQASRREKIVEQKNKQLTEEERREKQRVEESMKNREREYGQKIPDPDDSGETELNLPEEEEEQKDFVGNDQIEDGTGTSVLPRTEDQPFPDREIEVTIPGDKEIAKLVREEAEKRGSEPSEFVTNALKVHFRRRGDLQDTPKAEISSSD